MSNASVLQSAQDALSHGADDDAVADWLCANLDPMADL